MDPDLRPAVDTARAAGTSDQTCARTCLESGHFVGVGVGITIHSQRDQRPPLVVRWTARAEGIGNPGQGRWRNEPG